MQITAFCFIQSATTGFTANVFSYPYRVSLKEAFEGPEPDDGKLSRPVLRGPAPSNGGWLLGGAPRIHGELLKFGIDIGETSVSKYLVRCRKPPSQTWRTFLENHAQQLVSIDFFTVPTIRFQVLYVFLVLAHDRRRILHFNVTAHPTADWTGQQLRSGGRSH